MNLENLFEYDHSQLRIMRSRGFKPEYAKIPMPIFKSRGRSTEMHFTKTTEHPFGSSQATPAIMSPNGKVDAGEAILAAEWITNNPTDDAVSPTRLMDQMESFNKTSF